MSTENTSLNAWEPEVCEVIDKYRELILAEFRASEPEVEYYDQLTSMMPGSPLEFSEANTVLALHEDSWDILQTRQARIVNTRCFGFRAMSFPKTILAKVALSERKSESDIEVVASEKVYLRADDLKTGTRPLSVVRLKTSKDNIEAEDLSVRQNLAIASSAKRLATVSELELFFLEAVDLITI